MENPVYFCNTLGTFIPSSDWLFSKIAARTLGNAKALPFKVCTKSILPWLSLYLIFSLLDWKVSKLDTDETSSHFSWAGENISKS